MNDECWRKEAILEWMNKVSLKCTQISPFFNFILITLGELTFGKHVSHWWHYKEGQRAGPSNIPQGRRRAQRKSWSVGVLICGQMCTIMRSERQKNTTYVGRSAVHSSAATQLQSPLWPWSTQYGRACGGQGSWLAWQCSHAAQKTMDCDFGDIDTSP